MEIVGKSFSYARTGLRSAFDDGSYTDIGGDVYIKMWGGEVTFFVTGVTQGGLAEIVMVERACDSPVKVHHRWRLRRPGTAGPDWAEEVSSWKSTTLSDLAGIVAAHCDDETRESVREMLAGSLLGDL